MLQVAPRGCMTGAGKHVLWCVMVNLEPTVVDMVRTMPVTRRLAVATMPCTCSSPKMVLASTSLGVWVILEPIVVDKVRKMPSDVTMGGGDDVFNMLFFKMVQASTSLVMSWSIWSIVNIINVTSGTAWMYYWYWQARPLVCDGQFGT